MFDFLRNLTKPAEEKRQEMLAAYLDGVLSPAERQQFEEMLAQDPGLQAELEQQQAVKQMLSQVPPRRVPRNFTLDPVQYGRPARQPLIQYYPALRAATVLTAVLLFFAVGLGVFTSGNLARQAPAADIALEPSTAQEAVEVTRVVAEVEAEEAAEEAPAEEAPAAAAPAEEAQEEEMMEEAEVAEEPQPLAEEEGPETETALDAAAGESEGAPSATQVKPEPTPSPLATQSILPRVVSPEVPDRSVITTGEAVEPTALAFYAGATEQPPVTDESIVESDTAVTSTEEQASSSPEQELFNLITLVQIGLVVLLIVLVGLTLYTRRQFS